jgi:hypothetical protein
MESAIAPVISGETCACTVKSPAATQTLRAAICAIDFSRRLALVLGLVRDARICRSLLETRSDTRRPSTPRDLRPSIARSHAFTTRYYRFRYITGNVHAQDSSRSLPFFVNIARQRDLTRDFGSLPHFCAQ